MHHRRLHQVQSLATTYCYWHDAHTAAVTAGTNTTPAFDVSHVVLSGPRKRWLDKDSTGLFLFPSHFTGVCQLILHQLQDIAGAGGIFAFDLKVTP
jgi:hypothetical protein